jgi:hypothetical protein
VRFGAIEAQSRRAKAENEKETIMRSQKYDCIIPLTDAGIKYTDALDIRRIAMTLHRWSELECGDEHGCVERDEKTNKTYWLNATTSRRSPIPDRETGALKRLEKIMARYPALKFYVQGDPRGAPLYILRPGDVPDGRSAESYYNHGIAVCK